MICNDTQIRRRSTDCPSYPIQIPHERAYLRDAGTLPLQSYDGRGDLTSGFPDGTEKKVGSGLKQPAGVALNSADDVFVADWGKHRIIEIRPGHGERKLGNGLDIPSAVAVDPDGKLFIADTYAPDLF